MNDLIYPDELSSLDHIGIFHLNIDQAALLIAKCLWMNEEIEKEFDDELFYDHQREPDLIKYLKDEIQKYQSVLILAIDDGKLEAPLIKRDLEEALILDETYIDAEKLVYFLSERGVEIYGDAFAAYAKEQSRLLEIARTAIEFGERRQAPELIHTTQEYILSLESQINELKSEKGLPELPQGEELHTKEKNTLLKLLLGLALTNYEFNPRATRNATAREITSDLALHNLNLDEDTVRKWLNEAKELLPIDWEIES